MSHQVSSSPACFPVYSVAKPWIATALVQQADEGKLSLDDPVARWHPEVPGAETFTVRQLLGHRAGLRDYGALPAYHQALADHPGRAWTREEYGQHTWSQGLQSPPGETFAYSNPGYRLAQEIAAQVDGCDVAEVLRRRILQPLALEHTFALESPADYGRLERGVSTRLATDGDLRDVRESMDPGWVFHATLGSTAGECVRVLAALAGGDLVSPEGLAAMTELRPIGFAAPPSVEPSYGLGLMGDRRSPHGPIFGHNGGGPGYTASVFHAAEHPAGPLTVAVLCAVEAGDAAESILRHVMQELAPT